jgi:DNA-binding response OmpR family regulator
LTRILVVEDDPKLGFALEDGLSEARYAVDLAVDGDEALAYAHTSVYDAMVLDVLLPRVDGLEVCRRLRTAGTTTPILLLTARDSLEDKVDGLDSGADDYLTKPFALAELLARLRALLRRDAARKEGVLRVGDLALDPAARSVQRGNRFVELTEREYCVLETLVRRSGWVVRREALVESVWGFDYPDSSNLIDVYIGRLRRKLSAAGEPPLIETVRGAGYRLREAAP